MSKILAIGDQHFQWKNYIQCKKFISSLITIIKREKPDLVVFMGDLLHEHEWLYSICLNLALVTLLSVARLCEVYVLVGNHDYYSNTEFLNNNHWLNVFKGRRNIRVIDQVIEKTINGNRLLFVPYVYPGRFIEAIQTHLQCESDLLNYDVVFCHQEFMGAQMGCIKSQVGDRYREEFPLAVSGHIHNKDWLQPNIYYVGSCMQHAFGEIPNKSISTITVTNNAIIVKDIEITVGRREIIYYNLSDDVSELNSVLEKAKNKEITYRLSVSGDYSEFKSFTGTKICKEIENAGVKVHFSKTRKNKTNQIQQGVIQNIESVDRILEQLVDKEENNSLTELYYRFFKGENILVL